MNSLSPSHKCRPYSHFLAYAPAYKPNRNARALTQQRDFISASEKIELPVKQVVFPEKEKQKEGALLYMLYREGTTGVTFGQKKS